MASLSSATVYTRVAATLSKSLAVIGDKALDIDKIFNRAIAAGSGVDQATKAYVGELSIAAAGNSSIDLSGSLEDIFGDAAVFTKVKALLIWNASSDQTSSPTTAQVTVTGNFLTTVFGASSSWVLEAGDQMTGSWTRTGKTVTNSTADTITVTNNDGAQAAKVYVIVIGI